MGIKILTPERLLEYYNDEMLEKNINKIEELTKFVDKIKSDPKLKEKYSIKIEKYIGKDQPRSRFHDLSFRPKRNIFEEDDVVKPNRNIFDED